MDFKDVFNRTEAQKREHFECIREYSQSEEYSFRYLTRDGDYKTFELTKENYEYLTGEVPTKEGKSKQKEAYELLRKMQGDK
jgi:hypothetical protein